MKIKEILITAVLALIILAPASKASDTVLMGEELIIAQPTFEAAWQNYLYAFEPFRQALSTGDYSTAKQRVEKLKEVSKTLGETKIPEKARKPIKEVLKYNKQLLKAAAHGDRNSIQVNFDRLKEAIARVENLRQQKQSGR